MDFQGAQQGIFVCYRVSLAPDPETAEILTAGLKMPSQPLQAMSDFVALLNKFSGSFG
jgi:hypothetical protein